MRLYNQDLITVDIGGDICPDGKVEKVFLHGGLSLEDFFKSVKESLNKTDFFILNLECSLTTKDKPISKNGPWFKANPETVGLLNHLGVDLITLANNHILDFREAGLRDTIDCLAKNEINTVGAGLSLEEARRIYYRTIKNRILAVINVAENEFCNATPTRGGANPLDLISLLSDIRVARQNADHVILILHGGLERVYYPSLQSVRLLRFLAEQGLTAVIRNHPHFVQGFEVWKDVPIFYSLGNFLFDSPNKSQPGWFEGILVRLNIGWNDQCTIEVHPFHQCKKKPGIRMLKGAEKESFFERFNQYSEVIQDPDKHEQKWRSIVDEKKQIYYGSLSMPSHFLFRAFRKLNLLSLIQPSQRKKFLYENYLRCETHREVLINILEKEHTG